MYIFVINRENYQMNKKNYTLFFSFLLLNLFLVSSVFSQTKEELQRQKKLIENEIRYTNKLLKETKKNQKASTNQIVLLKKKIEQREKLIETISMELNSLDEEIVGNTQTIESLNLQLKKLKDEYAKMIYYAYKNRKNYDRLMFVLSSDNFNQAYRRIRYFQLYSSYRKRQASLINETQESIKNKNSELEQFKNQKVNLLTTQQTEKNKLTKEQQNKNKTLTELNKKEKELRQTLKEKEKASKDLQNAIASIIAEEIRKAEAKRVAEDKKNNKRPPTTNNTNKNNNKSNPVNKISMTPEEKDLANSFAANKGKLPWPLEKGVICSNFGEHPHPVLTGVVIKNNGIDISTSRGANVRSIFNGVVSGVVTLPNGTKAIIIRHGDYLSVYANLATASVHSNDKVKTKQNIGTVSTDEDDGKTELHFELWQNKTLLNPSSWIAK